MHCRMLHPRVVELLSGTLLHQTANKMTRSMKKEDGGNHWEADRSEVAVTVGHVLYVHLAPGYIWALQFWHA